MVARTPPGTDITYEIQNNPETLVIQTPFAAYTPRECVYDLTYVAAHFGNGNPLPQFLTFSPQTGFQVQTSNPNDFGTYSIELTATVNGPNTVGEVDLVYTFTLGRCQLDQVFQVSNIQDVTYIIGTGPLIVDTFIQNTFSECPLTFELTQNGQPYDEDTLDLLEEDRIIVIESSDRDANGDSFEFILTVTDESGN